MVALLPGPGLLWHLCPTREDSLVLLLALCASLSPPWPALSQLLSRLWVNTWCPPAWQEPCRSSGPSPCRADTCLTAAANKGIQADAMLHRAELSVCPFRGALGGRGWFLVYLLVRLELVIPLNQAL